MKNNFRNNYKQSNLLCPMCELTDDTQEHLFECTSIKEEIHYNNVHYNDIFSNNIDTLLNAAKMLKKIVDIREKLQKVIDPED